MDIGEPERTIIVEPLEDPVPRREPVPEREPERPREDEPAEAPVP